MDIDGRHFVVSGAGNGIGREVALAILQAGGSVSALDLSEAGLAGTTARAPHDARLTTHVVDVADRSVVDRLPEVVIDTHGHVDGLINVAGIIQPFLPIADLSQERMAQVMDVNFWGVVHLTKAFLPLLLDRPAAAIVNVSSMGALTPVPGQAAYGASKAAVKLFSEALYAELHGTSVAVTTVFPGAVATHITANSGVAMPVMRTAGRRTPRTTPPSEAGRRIVEAIRLGPYRLMIGSDVTALDRLSRLAPRRATELLARQMRSLLP